MCSLMMTTKMSYSHDRAGNGLVPFEDEFISWSDPEESKYQIASISLASDLENALWEFYAPRTGNILALENNWMCPRRFE